jgi:hypothetical protein
MIMKKIFTLIVMLTAAIGMQAQDTWTVAGTEALLGSGWSVEDTNNDMTSTDGTIFTLVKKDVALKGGGKYEFKVVKNHSWDEAYPGENALVEIAEDGAYTVTFTFNAETKEVSSAAEKTGEASFGETTWTIAGVAAICGSEWDPKDTSNDLKSTDGVNYTIVKTDLVLEAGVSYAFKVVGDHDWGEAYPGDNYTFTVNETGKYTVTIKFNKDSKEISVETEKTGDAVIAEKTWTIAGVEALMGSNWDNTDTNNDMTNMGDGTYQLVKKDVVMEAEKAYEFKVLANHSWGENYGADGVADGPNVTISVETAGTYDVTFVWNPESKELYATAEPVYPADPESVNSLKSSFTANSAVYNLQGQRVKANFRGIAIKNGRKIIVK